MVFGTVAYRSVRLEKASCMILRAYLTESKTRVDDFAAEIDASRGAVLKWISGERYPRYDYLQRIYEATNGAVTANDFYERKAQQIQKRQDNS